MSDRWAFHTDGCPVLGVPARLKNRAEDCQSPKYWRRRRSRNLGSRTPVGTWRAAARAVRDGMDANPRGDFQATRDDVHRERHNDSVQDWFARKTRSRRLGFRTLILTSMSFPFDRIGISQATSNAVLAARRRSRRTISLPTGQGFSTSSISLRNVSSLLS